MLAPPLEEMRIVASRLKPLNIPFAFVGGAVMCLLVDHPELTDFRRTKDVDVVVAAITYFEFAALEAPRSPKPRHRPCTCVSRGPKIAWSNSLSCASGLFGDFPDGSNTRSLDSVRQRYRPSSIWTPALLLSQLNSLRPLLVAFR